VLGYGALLLLSVPVLLMGVYPDPFIEVASQAASTLKNPSAYIGSVFPEATLR